MNIARRFLFAAAIVIVSGMACVACSAFLLRDVRWAAVFAFVSILGSYVLAWVKDSPRWRSTLRFLYTHLPELIVMAIGWWLLAEVSDNPQLGWLVALIGALIIVAFAVNGLIQDLSLRRMLSIALRISLRLTLLSLMFVVIFQGVGRSPLNPVVLSIGVIVCIWLILPWHALIVIWSRIKWIVVVAAIFVVAQTVFAQLAALPRRINESIVYAIVVFGLTLASLLRFRSVDRFLARLIDWLTGRSD